MVNEPYLGGLGFVCMLPEILRKGRGLPRYPLLVYHY